MNRQFDENQVDELLRQLAERKAASVDVDALFVRATANLPPRKPQGWIARLVRQALMPAVATLLLLVGMLVAIMLIRGYEPTTIVAQPHQTCEIEKIESYNSTAIIANGTGSEPTVIWIFEE